MTCSHYQEIISQFIDGELQPDSEADLFGHLSRCEECRTFLKDLLSLKNTTAQAPLLSVPDSLDRRIFADLHTTKNPSARRKVFHRAMNARYSFRTLGFAIAFSLCCSFIAFSVWFASRTPQQTIVCFTPLPEVEVNGYVVVAQTPMKGIKQ